MTYNPRVAAIAAISAIKKEKLKKSTTLKSRIFATDISINATAALITAIFTANVTHPQHPPVGITKKYNEIRIKKNICLMWLANSISANDLPEYSSTIASCTMVNSRCVSWLSTGMREVSAIATIKTAIPAKRLDTLRPLPGTIHRTKTAIKAAGSAKLEMNISRDDPIPPNEEPASRAASARKKRPNPKTKKAAISIATPFFISDPG